MCSTRGARSCSARCCRSRSIVTLALALAANSTTFSLMDALVLRPYRFAGVDRLRGRHDRGAGRRRSSIGSTSRPRISASGANNRRPSRTGRCTSGGTPTCRASTFPSRFPAFFVSPGFFELLGSRPIMGREFTESEAQPGQHHRVVLGHGLWAAAIRIRSEHRRQERAARRRAVRSRRRCAAGLHHT